MIQTYDEALDKIYSYVDYSMSHADTVSREAFLVDAIRELMDLLGNPQNSYAVIHVAGTKGKGSVCAMLAAALKNAGFKTGLYTSPHLIRYNERIQVNGKMISDQDVIALTEKVDSCVQKMSLHASSFDFMTAMAFEYFKEQRVDIAVVETGLGGRLDSTNIVDPMLTIITSISMDHTNFLGDTIEKIAWEKAGIIKTGVPVICGAQPFPAAAKVIEDTAHEKRAPWISVSDRYRYINERQCGMLQCTRIWRVEDQKLIRQWASGKTCDGWEPDKVESPLRGGHQTENAAVVYAALQKVKAKFSSMDISMDMDKALEGIRGTFWPGRFETLSETPLLILDGAHNEDSMKKLGAALDCLCGTKRVKCVFGASEDKMLKNMIGLLAPHVDEFILTRADHPRAANPKLLAEYAAETGRKNHTTATIQEAYELFTQETDPNVCWLVAGSLFVAGQFRELHMARHPEVPYFAYND